MKEVVQRWAWDLPKFSTGVKAGLVCFLQQAAENNDSIGSLQVRKNEFSDECKTLPDQVAIPLRTLLTRKVVDLVSENQ